MSDDLNSLLGDWRYDANAVNARRIEGADGKPKIQLRLDLGVLQMEVEDRPDGRHPDGFPSLLESYLDREQKQELADEEPFVIDQAAAMDLQQEAAQYYYRYIAFYALRDLKGVISDTAHNLALIDLVDRHTDDDELAWQFLQFYPYVRMMNARAQGEWLADGDQFDQAIEIVEEGLAEIREFWTAHTEEGPDQHPRELDVLTELLEKLKARKPRSKVDLLQEELRRAIAAENYERAAALRDAIESLPRRGTPEPS